MNNNFDANGELFKLKLTIILTIALHVFFPVSLDFCLAVLMWALIAQVVGSVFRKVYPKKQ